MKKAILLSLMLVSFVGFSQEKKNIDINTEDGEVVIEPYTPHEQRNEKSTDPNQVYSAVEVMPQYYGGIEKLNEFFKQNFKIPNLDRDLKGRIFMQFIVEKDGSLSDVKVIRDLGYGTGKEAIRVLKLTEKWKAGLQNGRPVRVNYIFPFQLDLEKSTDKEE